MIKSVSDILAANPMIQEALDRAEETTGLCTVREVADWLIGHDTEECELTWVKEGYRTNVMVIVIGHKKID